MNSIRPTKPGLSRRHFLAASGVGAVAFTALPFDAAATPENVNDAIKMAIGDKPLLEERISMVLPEIAENGGTVPLKVSVDSPMSADDHVTALYIFADGNPLPEVADYYFGPYNGKAELSIRIRLMKTQKVVAVAETSTGQALVARKEIKVTIGGCGG